MELKWTNLLLGFKYLQNMLNKIYNRTLGTLTPFMIKKEKTNLNNKRTIFQFVNILKIR